ncbi:MAG: hypothetical protein WCA20_30960 [Candidatus Sulfotelmatobacter sp.]
MAAPGRPDISRNSRFEFDAVNEIRLARLKGRLTDELLAELYGVTRKYSIATDARAGIWDLSSVNDLAVSSGFVRSLADQEPAMPDATKPRIIVAPTTIGFGLARMFQILGESTRPLLTVVRTMDEALATLGVQSPHFKPLE